MIRHLLHGIPPEGDASSPASVPLASRLRRWAGSSYVRQVLQTLATRAVMFAMGVVSGVLIARLLGPQGRGALAVAGTLGGLGSQFANLGLHSANTYYAARDRRLLPALAANSLLLSALLGAGAMAVLGGLVRFRPSLAPLSRPLLALVLLSIPLGLAFLFGQSLLLGIREVRTYNKIELVNRLLSFLSLAFLFALALPRADVVYLAGLLATALALVWALWAVAAHVDGPLRPSMELLRRTLGYGFKAWLACLFAFLVMRIDLLMVQYYVGLEQAGYYATAASLGNFLYVVPAIAGTIAFPRLAALKDPRRRWSVTRTLALVTGLLMLPACGLAFLVAPQMIRLLYTAEFLPAVPAFRLLAVAMIFYGVNNIFSNYLAAMEFPRFAVYVWVVATVVNVVLNVYLLPIHGISGAAMASIVAYALVLVAQFVYCVLRARRHASQA